MSIANNAAEPNRKNSVLVVIARLPQGPGVREFAMPPQHTSLPMSADKAMGKPTIPDLHQKNKS
jgi:hypothetical protein